MVAADKKVVSVFPLYSPRLLPPSLGHKVKTKVKDEISLVEIFQVGITHPETLRYKSWKVGNSAKIRSSTDNRLSTTTHPNFAELLPTTKDNLKAF